MTNSKKLYTRLQPINRVSVVDIQQMYDVFRRYYDLRDLDTFVRDLSKKTAIVIVRERESNRVVGFSTLLAMDIKVGGKTARGVFSGDTIMEKEYWGSKALNNRIAQYMFAEKLRNLGKPVYWMLISKGYKTFLLLTNNFMAYYPNRENRHPHLKKVVEHYCDRLFPGCYDEKTGVLDFGDRSMFLKGEVAGITEEMREAQPNIAFFEERNPEWARGTELPCVGVLDMPNFLRFAMRAMKGKKSRKSTAAAFAQRAGVESTS